MSTVFYKKQGRRYVPVAQYDLEYMSSLPKGAHLVLCDPGQKSQICNIDPNRAALIAASRSMLDAMVQALVRASEVKPATNRALTEAQIAAWNNLIEALGEDGRMLRYDSAHDICKLGVDALMTEAAQLMENESVRRAYDHFLLMCKLASAEIGKNK